MTLAVYFPTYRYDVHIIIKLKRVALGRVDSHALNTPAGGDDLTHAKTTQRRTFKIYNGRSLECRSFSALHDSILWI